ncbi:uncharacterized protein K02A2.6-like [Ornithodoros turicata]|uniref:uncharacterized protein K02A2.6-like n=1 Tax=Ornithodoros turicata TaxID=34597 RepID=UPI003138A888
MPTYAGDNGPAFVSSEYKAFLKRNRIKQLLIPPYHPASNGAAERVVQTVKAKLKKSVAGDFKTQIARFLLHYRSQPHAVTGLSPAELLVGRKLKTALDCLQPNLRENVVYHQLKQKLWHDQHARNSPEPVPGDRVFARNFRQGPAWVPAEVTGKKSASSADLRLADGTTWHRHLGHMRGSHSHILSPASTPISPRGPEDPRAGATSDQPQLSPSSEADTRL